MSNFSDNLVFQEQSCSQNQEQIDENKQTTTSFSQQDPQLKNQLPKIGISSSQVNRIEVKRRLKHQKELQSTNNTQDKVQQQQQTPQNSILYPNMPLRQGFLKSKKIKQEISCQLQYKGSDSEEQLQNQNSSQKDIQILFTRRNAPLKPFEVQMETKQFIQKIFPPQFTCTLSLKVQTYSLGFCSRYMLFYQNKFIVSAKKEKLNLSETRYIISRDPYHINRRAQDYVADLRGNFFGTEFQLQKKYEDGYESVLHIEFQNNVLGGLRKLQVIKTSPTLNNKQLPLETLIESNHNNKLLVMKSKEPKLNQKNMWEIDFHGKAKIPSRSNFIIERNSVQNLLLAKVRQNQYILQVKSPLNILQAFSICLSNFQSKILVK